MSKDKISDYSTVASNNTDIAAIGIQGTNAVRNFDDAFRTIMKQLADMNAGTSPIFDTFTLCDPADNTKLVRVDAGNVTTATTRVLTMANENVDLGAMAANIAFRRGNILGSVSQSGGVPTGALIERGSNANGEYVRFADSTMICTHKVDISATAISTARGSLFGTAAALTWTYPVAFTVTPSVTGVFARNDLTLVGGVSILSPTASATTYQPWLSASLSAGNVKDIYFTAVGRWF